MFTVNYIILIFIRLSFIVCCLSFMEDGGETMGTTTS